MGNKNDSKAYEVNKVNIIICGDISSEINNKLINYVFEKAPDNYEFKKKIDLNESQEYLFFYGEILKGKITEELIEQIKKKINMQKNDNKNIVICFSNQKKKINLVKDSLQNLKPKSIIPFIIFVKNNSFSKNLEKIKKLSQISYIEYFGNSEKDIKDANTLKTCEIFKSKILQIDGYFNERGTLFSEYLFGLLNNAKREVKKDDKINDILPGNRNSLNIFLFGEARAGKSRFINLSMNNLVSRENCSSSHVTKKFTKYALPMSNNENGELGQIVLYDSPGLTEDKDVVKEFKNLVESTLNIFKEKKENNSILLYFIKRGGGISNNILNFVKFLNDKKFNILFVITHSKKGSVITNNYRNEIISQLKLNNTFTDINLKKLNNDGENIISVNLKEDSDTGEFYGLRDIYREILKIFPENFIDEIENNNFNDLNQLFGFIAYKKYFFLNNVLTKDDFLKKISYKLDRVINISAQISSLAGLIPIPFADIPIILFLEVGIIKYAAKLYGFNDNDYNIIKLMTFNTGGLT